MMSLTEKIKPLILKAEQADDPVQTGGKAHALAKLQLVGFPVPPWFVITPQVFFRCLPEALRQQWPQLDDITTIRNAVASLQINESTAQHLHKALRDLCPQQQRVAVRSSAAGEDGSEHSFAGQLESVLFVTEADLLRRVQQVWLSGFSERICVYRQEQKLAMPPPPPAVLVQRMINAQMAGVAFSADPVSGRRGVCVVGAVYGLGSALVSGDADADTWHVDRHGQIIERQIAHKRVAHRMDEAAVEGVSIVNVESAKSGAAVLNDSQIQRIAALARRCQEHFGCPQDIEWAIEDDQLYLLQSRPITSLRALPDPDATLTIWDNSNIAESYRGVTTPLTFSFARRAYESVYREFCHMLRVPRDIIEAQDDVFARMLGLIRGRVYYNLISWYRVLAMLPGFRLNRHFMEQMMGVKEPMPDEIIDAIAPPVSRADRIRDAGRLLMTLGGLIANHFKLPRRIRKFYARLNSALAPPAIPLTQQRVDELVAYYRDLERQLLKRWDAPLVNDFLAMIFYGVLRKLCSKWCGDTDGTLQNALITAEGGIISAEPAQRIRALATLALAHPELVDVLVSGNVTQIRKIQQQFPEFDQGVQSYLARFADRCLDELKLESPTLQDDPLPFLRSVGHMARRLQNDPRAAAVVDEHAQRLAAEQRVRQQLGWNLWRRMMFHWVLKNARTRVKDRENLRFERTRLFGRVRRIFVEIGLRLHAEGLLDEPRDIFYLEVGEVVNYVESTSGSMDLKSIIAARKHEFNTYEQGTAPADRFNTRGLVYHAHDYQSTRETPVISGDALNGIGCCPGVVRGQVRVVRDPRGVELRQGEILVAERTDPGWIMLFPAAAGLLVEHGSLLSHSAIVAREMGIPAVVALTGITSWLQDGDWVELDGKAGRVRRMTQDENKKD